MALTRYPRSLLVIVSVCFFLSGFAALLYQTAWLREFSIVFGTSELAVAMVLAVYMGGLALGAAVAEPLVERITRPVLVYGLLEAGIAVAALCVPFALGWAGTLYATMLGNQPLPPDASGLGQSAFYLLAGFLILTIPTGLMGATLPVLMRSVVRTDAEIGPRVALLYGINTAGAVAGAVIAGFVLLGSLGLRGTVWVGVAVNILIFVIAALAAIVAKRYSGMPAVAEQPMPAASPGFVRDCLRPLWSGARSWREALTRQPAWILPVMLISGANTFIYEVLWTRLLSHVMGSSIHAFATMLAAFLTGIALGGGVAARFARTRQQAAGAFIYSQISIAVISLGVFVFLDVLLPETTGLAVNVMLAASVLLPPAICIGVTFPLAVRILTPDAQSAAKCTARVYAWNTSGAIIGAIFAGFFLIPGLGFEGAIQFAVLVNLALALAVAALVATRSRPLQLGLLLSIVVIALFVHPNRPDAILRGSSMVAKSGVGTDLYFGVGRSSTVRLTELDHGYEIRNNGLPESQIAPRGTPPFFDGWTWLTSLPSVARPEAKSMLVVGLGGASTLESLPPTIREVHVVELEEEVVIANRLVGPMRNVDPLIDPRVTVIVNDARNALRLTGREYDIIVSQPSQPWTPGASHLYTTEFARLAKSRLKPDGVLLQWMSASFLDLALLKTLTATLTDVFGYVRLYDPGQRNLMFVASDAPLDIEQSLSRALRKPGLAEHLPAVGIASSEDLLAALLLDESASREFAAGAPLSNDDFNLMATKSLYLQNGLTIPELVSSLSAVDPLANPDFWDAMRPLEPQVNYAYLSTRIGQKYKSPDRLRRLAAALEDKPQAHMVEAMHSLITNKPNKARQQFNNLLSADVDNQQARYVLVFMQLKAVLAGTASRKIQAEAAALTGVPAALLNVLRHEQAGDWSAVAALDEVLARARSTDLWYMDVAKIRAAWRLRPGLDNPQMRAAEALRIIDEAIPIQIIVSVPLLVLRATAEEILGDAPAVMETSLHVAAQYQQILRHAAKTERPLTPAQRAKLGVPLGTVVDMLQAHPEWRQMPRGPAVYGLVDEVAEQFLAP